MKPLLITSSLILSLGTLPLSAAVVISGGHIDVPAFGYDSLDGFEPHLHNEGGPTGAIVNGVREETDSEYEADEAIIQIPLTSTTSLNSVTYFWLPDNATQASNNGTPFVGFGLEELTPADWNGNMTLKLIGITGPGDFLLWTYDINLDPVTLLDSNNLALSFDLPPGAHEHFNWGFTDEGIYQLTFEISGDHVTDGIVSGSGTFTFAIPEPSTALLGAIGALGLLRRRR